MGPIQTHLTSQKKSTVSLYNVNLQIELSELISYHPDCSITYIDVQTSLEFLGQTVGEDLRLSTESLQAIATVIIEQAIIPNYNFIVPEEILLAQFRQAFHANWRTDKNSILGILISDPSIDYHKASLSEIIQHAKDKPRSRTANILKALGWIDIAGSITKKMTCITPHPLIKSTWDNPEDITSKVEYK